MSNITRRELLEIAAAAALTNAAARPSEANPTPAVKRELYTGSLIEIYTGTLSAAPGDKVTLHVSTIAKRFHLQIARVGLTEDLVWERNDLPGVFHPTPDDAWEKGCGWPATVSLEIPPNWRSGFYQISAITADKNVPPTTYRAFVVVRAVRPTAKVLLVHPTATYGAYNSYGGASLYVAWKNDTKGGYIGGARRVSFLRPWMPGFLSKPPGYGYHAVSVDKTVKNKDSDWDDRGILREVGVTSWSYVAGFDNWDRVLIEWLEREGYSVDYAISTDLELHPELLNRYRLMLSVGHDEYCSWGMRDTIESFVAKGGNVCFFSADMCWQVRFEDNGHTMVCYKDAVEEDPMFNTAGKKHLTSTLWSSRIVSRLDSMLTGLNVFYGGWTGVIGGSVAVNAAGGHIIYRPEHWAFKDCGFKYGDCLGTGGKIVQFETDGCPIRFERGLPYPGEGYDGPATTTILGLYPTNWGGFNADDQLQALKKLLGDPSLLLQAALDDHGHAVMGMFTNNGTVFAAGTTDWTNGLTGKDPIVEQVTRNLLNRLSA